MDKSITCCFTGHRNIPSCDAPRLYAATVREIVALYNKGYRNFLAGGALGFDTMAANAVLDLKNKYPIRLILVLPCENQCRGWHAAEVREYERILSLADKVFYTSTEYTRGCMLKRNRTLVDNSSICIAYMTRATGGTAYTVRYAESTSKQIIRIQ